MASRSIAIGLASWALTLVFLFGRGLVEGTVPFGALDALMVVSAIVSVASLARARELVRTRRAILVTGVVLVVGVVLFTLQDVYDTWGEELGALAVLLELLFLILVGAASLLVAVLVGWVRGRASGR